MSLAIHEVRIPARETYTLMELAAKLGVSRTVAYDLARTGDLPVRPIRIGRRYLFPKVSVDSLLAGEPKTTN